jgi:hypothetical protein
LKRDFEKLQLGTCMRRFLIIKLILCHGKVKDIYKSKELWRGPESIYTLQQGLCVAHDILEGCI